MKNIEENADNNDEKLSGGLLCYTLCIILNVLTVSMHAFLIYIIYL